MRYLLLTAVITAGCGSTTTVGNLDDSAGSPSGGGGETTATAPSSSAPAPAAPAVTSADVDAGVDATTPPFAPTLTPPPPPAPPPAPPPPPPTCADKCAAATAVCGTVDGCNCGSCAFGTHCSGVQCVACSKVPSWDDYCNTNIYHGSYAVNEDALDCSPAMIAGHINCADGLEPVSAPVDLNLVCCPNNVVVP